MDSKVKIGLDCRNDTVFASHVELRPGRHEVKALIRLNRNFPLEHHLLENGDLVLAIPDNDVMVKKLFVPEDSILSRNELAGFEIARTLLDEEMNYKFDTLNTGHNSRMLSSIIRIEKLNEIIKNYNAFSLRKNLNEMSGAMRSIALGRGYLNFCHQEKGNLLCLSDINDTGISICFIYNKKIVNVAQIEHKKYNLEKNEDIENLIIDFKTVLNYKLASLFDEGITVPLSSMILTNAEETLAGIIKDKFNFEILSPRINSGFFTDSSLLEEIPINNYIVSLGLSVN